MMLAFTCIYWGTRDLSWSRAFEISVSSLTTMGFAEPNGPGRIWIAFVEATIGLGLVALLISYLPTIYSAYNGREKGTNRLRPIAGSPPSATELPPEPATPRQPREPRLLAELSRLDARPRADPHRVPDPHLLPRDPTPSSRGWPPWGRCSTRPRWSSPSPTIDVGRGLRRRPEGAADGPRLRAPADRAHRPGGQHPAAPADAAPRPHGAFGRARTGDQHQPGRVRRRHGGAVAGILVVEPGREEEAWRRFAWIRSAYDPALRALAGVTLASPAPWTTDRPAEVGKPRFLRRRPLHVDWSQGCRPAPPSAGARYRWLKPPDSSLVIGTVTGWRSKWAMACFMSSSRSPARSRLTPWRTRIRCTEMSETEPVSG